MLNRNANLRSHGHHHHHGPHGHHHGHHSAISRSGALSLGNSPSAGQMARKNSFQRSGSSANLAWTRGVNSLSNNHSGHGYHGNNHISNYHNGVTNTVGNNNNSSTNNSVGSAAMNSKAVVTKNGVLSSSGSMSALTTVTRDVGHSHGVGRDGSGEYRGDLIRGGSNNNMNSDNLHSMNNNGHNGMNSSNGMSRIKSSRISSTNLGRNINNSHSNGNLNLNNNSNSNHVITHNSINAATLNNNNNRTFNNNNNNNSDDNSDTEEVAAPPTQSQAEAFRQQVEQRQQKPKIIFLDVDGVLHSVRVTRQEQLFNSQKMALLRRLLERTDSQIVLSSAWRRTSATLRMCNAMLSKHGLPQPIDVTPDYGLCGKRSSEILTWVDRFNITKWVAIDDLDLLSGEPRLRGHFLKCNPLIGLTQELVEEGVRILGGK